MAIWLSISALPIRIPWLSPNSAVAMLLILPSSAKSSPPFSMNSGIASDGYCCRYPFMIRCASADSSLAVTDCLPTVATVVPSEPPNMLERSPVTSPAAKASARTISAAKVTMMPTRELMRRRKKLSIGTDLLHEKEGPL